MIKINKHNSPQILIENNTAWTKALTDSISLYGSYDKIPCEQKSKLLSHYRHKDIQKELFESSFYKCAFCECKPGESGNIEVEHFAPKSLYPMLSFDWNNFLPACRKCNESKSDFDTISAPIINPADVDPETLLTYNFLRISPIKGTSNEELAENTIEVCNLNSSRLYETRASLLKSLTEYTDELKEKIICINEADTPQKRKIRITKLKNSLEKIDQLLVDSSVYSGYCRWYVSQCQEYAEATRLVLADNNKEHETLHSS